MDINTKFNIGDIVIDRLTKKIVRIIGIEYFKGRRFSRVKDTVCLGLLIYHVDDKYLKGERYFWQIDIYSEG
jgi:hypothetical protein